MSWNSQPPIRSWSGKLLCLLAVQPGGKAGSGEAHRDLGDLDPAAAHAREAITLAREAARQHREISACGTLATVLRAG